jgi:hypothetical protein
VSYQTEELPGRLLSLPWDAQQFRTRDEYLTNALATFMIHPMERCYSRPGKGPTIEIVREFISPTVQTVLQTWATDMLPHLRPNPRGKERFFRQVEELPFVPLEYTTARKRLQAKLKVSDDQRECEFGWFLGSIGDGGFIHQHMDRAAPGRRHLRCNLIVQAPDCGGEPVIEDRIYTCEERMLLCFFPSEQRHRCEPVSGPRRRIVCSFGYLVPMDYSL